MVDGEAPAQSPKDVPTADVLAALRALAGPAFDSLCASNLGVCVTDHRRPGEPIILVNRAFEDLTGFEASELIGLSARILLSDATDAGVIGDVERVLADHEASSTDLQLRGEDGQAIWRRLTVAPLRDAQGATAFHLCTLVDISAERLDPQPAALQQDGRDLRSGRERVRVTRSVGAAAGAWEWDLTAGVLIADARFAALYGLDPVAAASGLPTKAFYDPIHPDDLLRMKIALAGVRNGAEVFARDFRIISEDGAIRWVSARGRTWLDENDRPVRLSGVLADITDQKRAEERLRIAQSAGGVGTFEYLSGFGTVEVSEQFCRLLGLNTADSLPVRTINSLVHADDPPLIGQWGDPGSDNRTLRILRANDGEERWLTMRGEHHAHDATGAVSFTGVIYDVTEAKRAEARLRVLTETLEENIVERTQERDRIWNLSRDLLFVASSQGRFTALNPAWSFLAGRDVDQLLGTLVTALIHPDDAEDARAQLRSASQAGRSIDFDCRMRDAQGDWRLLNWTISSDGGALYGAGRDLTQRRMLEEQLRQAQKMEAVGQLTGGIAHDFNNMLTGILGGIEMVRKRLDAGRPQDAERFLNAASQSGERAAALTHRLLAFSRRQTLDTRATDVGALVLSMSDLMSRTMGEQVSVETSIPAGLWPAAADANQLESAILNLAINARDAMPHGGRLAISVVNRVLRAEALDPSETTAAGDYVEVSVSDSGVGMSASVISKVFEPFYTTKPLGQGTGLGLSMIYGFMQQLKGAVRISSVEGRGTTVRLLIPRHMGEAEAPPARIAAAPKGMGETVLVVEDDSTVRLLVLQVLEELGYRALEAADASAALPQLETAQTIDLMVTDVGLPGLNGRQLADLARQGRPNLPVLFITGYAHAAADDGLQLDAGMEVITKPFNIDELGRRIQGMIAAS